MSSLVSICIPTYNGAQFIAEAMDSAIAQTYPDLEIVVSDDASTDDTLKIVETYKTKTHLPIHIYHHKPKGIGANWNHCIKHAKGEYIKFLFQDDVLMPQCVSEMLAVLEKDVTLGMVSCKREILYHKDYDPKAVTDWLASCKDLQKGLNLERVDNLLIIDNRLFKSKEFLSSPKNKIGEPTAIMFKKELVEKIGEYRNDLVQILDFEFCYRALKTKRIAIIDKPLIKFRLHGNQATIKNSDSDDYYKYSKILYQDYLNFVDDYTRLHLLKKHNFFYKLYFKVKGKLKQIKLLLPKF